MVEDHLAINARIEQIKYSLLKKPGTVFSPVSKEANLPRAAVAMIIKPEPVNNDLLILLIKRNNREGDPWSGHMALPGGRYAETDHNLLSTVTREVMEETGLDIRELSVLGTLDEIVPGSSIVRVTPYVLLAHMSQDLSVRIDPKEIKDYVWAPISFFLNRKNRASYTVQRLNQKLEVPSYTLGNDKIVWGMTLRIIDDLISRIE